MNGFFKELSPPERFKGGKSFSGKYAPSEGHLDLRQTAWYVLPQTGIMGGRHGT